MSRVHVVVVCDHPLALLPLGNSSVVATAVQRAQAASCRPSVSVWLAENVREEWTKLPPRLRPECPAVADGSLWQHVQDLTAETLLIHDARRPLTLASTFDRVAAAVESGQVAAARPAHVVVDTLKILDADLRVCGTVNRDEVQSLTSPEGYHRPAVVGAGERGWRLSVAGPQEYVPGDPESIKVREPADVLLVESFLVWQTYS